MSQSGPSLPDRLSADQRTLLALVGVTVLALALRLVELGERIFHWDEGRVGYWAVRYAKTGHMEFAPIIHGPFLRVVNGPVFNLLGATDFTARLVVALTGGLLPLAVWLFREHLDRGELVALATLLAVNPLLVYYSRFMRNDVLVGAYAVVALGFAVRTIDTRRVWYLYPGAAFLALSLATKANTILYVLCFLGAGALVTDHGLVRATHGGASVRETVWSWWAGLKRAVADAAGAQHPVAARHPLAFVAVHVVGVALTFLAVTVFFYAPRPELSQALASPGQWSGVLHAATIGAAEELGNLWLSGEMQENPYLTYLFHEITTLTHGAAVAIVFALVGFVVDGYGRSGEGTPAGRNRAFVAFATYWALASLVGYPAATDINAPWSGVHIVLPLTVPAAVGLTYVVREGRAALDAADRETAALAALVLLVATTGVVAPNAAYWNSTNPDHEAMIQWAQPHNEAKDTITDIEAIAANHDDGVDVLFVGSDTSTRENAFYLSNESLADRQPAAGGWYDRLPLPWYLERANANVSSVSATSNMRTALDDAPPVVIVVTSNREKVDPHLEGYEARSHQLRQWGFEVTFYLEKSELQAVSDDS
ncbi:flippase activity-associated protein Agl23 [Haloparvum sp. PAK95]|uniref:flippase activity-associated protein Agl23 n=1 Tax=Haloparvum sp. PAK95 TaxID=3418962 RepID=UPI003D2F25F4